MEVQYISSSTVIIRNNETKILCDPWFIEGEYYGAWYHSNDEVDLEKVITECNDVDYIYVSHIHPDHFSRKSFVHLKKSIPILIHAYSSKFLKLNLERLGFSVIEINHGEEFSLGINTKIKIYAADNCNPELCQKFMGCSHVENKFGSTQIDSMSVIYDNNYSILNLNDCPIALSEEVIKRILKEFNKIDFLLVGYAGAGPYPQCFNMPIEDKILAAEKKKIQFLEQGLKYIQLTNPKYFMPYAGTYLLAGKLFTLNQYRGVPTRAEALEYFNDKGLGSKGILLNTFEKFNLNTKEILEKYGSNKEKKKEDYFQRLKLQLLDYETSNHPNIEDILELIPNAFKRLKNKVEEIKFNSETKLVIKIDDLNFIVIEYSPEINFSILREFKPNNFSRYVLIELDNRLLYNILRGPKYAHWNNAEIGSHLTYTRNPNTFERGLYHSLCYFHS